MSEARHRSPSRVTDEAPVTLDFSTACRDSDSFQRTEDYGMVVNPVGRFQFDVAITDSHNLHRVQMYVADHGLEGRCDCKGFKYSEGPCAHLWSVHKADTYGAVEVAPLRAALDGTPECPTCGGQPPEERL